MLGFAEPDEAHGALVGLARRHELQRDAEGIGAVAEGRGGRGRPANLDQLVSGLTGLGGDPDDANRATVSQDLLGDLPLAGCSHAAVRERISWHQRALGSLSEPLLARDDWQDRGWVVAKLLPVGHLARKDLAHLRFAERAH